MDFIDGLIRFESLKQAYQLRLLSVLGHQPTQDRLSRAMDMLTRETIYTFTPSGPMWLVINKGKSHEVTYEVDTLHKTCTCPDSEQGNLCKHRLAIELIISAEELYLDSIGEQSNVG